MLFHTAFHYFRYANTQYRVRYQVQYANPLNFAMEANKLASIIKLYNQDSDSLFVR
jgi:replication factor A1